jgi:ParB family transcriptional regulator, chromosome partitioning protein
VVEGARRVSAARLAGWSSISAIVDETETDEAGLIQRQLVANCQRADLTPMEMARAIDRLMKAGSWSGAEAATKLGLSAPTVSKLLALLVLPKDVQDQVHNGNLAASTAYEIAKTKDPAERSRLAREAISGALTRSSVIAQGSAARKQPSSARRQRHLAKSSRIVMTLGEGRRVTVSGPSMTLSALAAWAGELVDRLRRLNPPDMDLRDVAKAMSAQRK